MMTHDQSSGPKDVSEASSALGLQVIREIRAAVTHLPQHELPEPSEPILLLQDEGQPSQEEVERWGELTEKFRRIGEVVEGGNFRAQDREGKLSHEN